jgi:hypothetical protein
MRFWAKLLPRIPSREEWGRGGVSSKEGVNEIVLLLKRRRGKSPSGKSIGKLSPLRGPGEVISLP